MVYVKGMAGSAIASLTELGLSADPVRVSLDTRNRDINLDAFGGEIPADVQTMLAAAMVTMTVINVDRSVLDECLRLSMGAPTTVGQVARAGQRMGGGLARFAAGNRFIGLNIASPVAGKPWRFYYAQLHGTPLDHGLGTEKSVFTLSWRAIPYQADPWGGGTGAQNAIIYDHTLDT